VPDEQDKIDALFEDMFGYKAEDKPASPPQTPTARPKPRKKVTTPDPTPEAVDKAAGAVRDAVAADKRRRPVKTWRGVAKDALSVSYLKAAWWAAVIDRGVELGLFTRDEETLSFPYLIALEEPEEPVFEDEDSESILQKARESEPSGPCMSQKEWDAFVKAEQEKSLLPEGFGPQWSRTPPTRKPIPLKHPDDRKYAYHLECGHLSNALHKRKLEDGAEEIYCHNCHLKSPPDHRWMSLNRGVPMPVKRRRSEKNPHGDCCDEDGQYIGGLEGDCRYGHLKDPSKPICTYHADKPLWGRKG